MKATGWLVLGIGLALTEPLLPARDASASVSIAMTFDALVRSSHAVVVGTSVERRPVWEEARIVTYSRLHVDSPLAGELQPDDEVWVRTLGGVVADVGQVVDGEAELTVGRPSLMFLRHGKDGSYVVTGRAQGQFGLYTDDQAALRARSSSAVGALFPPKGVAASGALAADMIHGRAVADAARDIAAAWTRTHAP